MKYLKICNKINNLNKLYSYWNKYFIRIDWFNENKYKQYILLKIFYYLYSIITDSQLYQVNIGNNTFIFITIHNFLLSFYYVIFYNKILHIIKF